MHTGQPGISGRVCVHDVIMRSIRVTRREWAGMRCAHASLFPPEEFGLAATVSVPEVALACIVVTTR